MQNFVVTETMFERKNLNTFGPKFELYTNFDCNNVTEGKHAVDVKYQESTLLY